MNVIGRNAGVELHGTKQPAHIRYRPDIDGLRSIAIIPVVAFHAGVHWLSGGFVGVDIFFVISGFLITSILIREIEEDRFSIAAFYKRRIARILPALTLVLVVTSAASVMILLPPELRAYGRSLAATALFVSNFFFNRDATNYFAGAADEKPLLHTWSLAVEEQYYILFPLLLMILMRRMPSKLVFVICVISICSFLLSIVGLIFAKSADFYLLPSRIWELGMGALVALGAAPEIDSQKLRSWLSAAAVLMVVWALLLLTDHSRFPAYNAIPPCLGAALLIAYGQYTIIGKVLASRVPVIIGLVSYPLYLWHWPVIVLSRFVLPYSDSPGRIVLTIAAGFVLAFATTFLFERRLLPAIRTYSSRAVNVCGAAVIMLLALTGAGLSYFADQIRNYPLDVAEIANTPAEVLEQYRSGVCFISSAGKISDFRPDVCLRPDPAKPNYLLIGDSHAAMLWHALAERSPGVHFLQATAGGCPPVLYPHEPRRCGLIEKAINSALASKIADKAILDARWKSSDIPRLIETANALRRHGYEVIIFGPTVEYHTNLPGLVARSMIFGTPDYVSRAKVADKVTLDRTMSAAVRAHGFRYISIYNIICPNDQCRTIARRGVPMQSDYGHLTFEGSRIVAAQLPPL